jgi:hypothetical protein
VGIFGLDYGSAVRDRPDVSYTELEFLTALEQRQHGMRVFVFLLEENSADMELGPPEARQTHFRQRVLNDHGLTARFFTTPEDLRHEIYKALKDQLGGDQSAADARAWALATQRDTVESFESYLASRPSGPHHEEAQSRMASKLRDLIIKDPFNWQARYRYLQLRPTALQKLDVESVRSGWLIVDFYIFGYLALMVCAVLAFGKYKLLTLNKSDAGLFVVGFPIILGVGLARECHRRRRRLASELGPLPKLSGVDVIVPALVRRKLLKGHYSAWLIRNG